MALVTWEGSLERIYSFENLERLINSIQNESLEYNLPIAVSVTLEQNTYMLTVGGSTSTVVFSCNNERFYYPINPISFGDPFAYLYGGSYSEIGRERTVPWEQAYKGLNQFLESGTIPSEIPWEL